jgi:2',3'-cyclic-nucleotide 2'-phosphodiesterase (5'-nucleotidase family)
MRLIRFSIFVLLLSFVSTVVVAAGSDSKAEITVFFTGDVNGSYEPCGCKAGPTGGMARRVGYSQDFAGRYNGKILNVDAGNYFEDPGPNADAINAVLKRALVELPVQVSNLGFQDLYWWKELTTEELGETEFISTNLVPILSNLSAPAKYRVLEVPLSSGGSQHAVRIGFLGITDPGRVKPNSGFKGLDPLKAVRDIKEEVMGQADFLFLLADIIRPQGEIPNDHVIRQLAEEHSEIYVIVTTEKRFILYPPTQINSAIIVSSVERGRYLGQMKLVFDDTGSLQEISSELVEMKKGVPEDAVFLDSEKRISRQLK